MFGELQQGTAGEVPPVNREALREVIDLLARLVDIATEHGPFHVALSQAVVAVNFAIQALLIDCPEVVLECASDSLMINGIPAELSHPSAAWIHKRLSRLGLKRVRFLPGLEEEELSALIRLLVMADTHGPRSLPNLEHIALERKAPSPAEAVVSFLRGETTFDDDGIADHLRRSLRDPEEMAVLIEAAVKEWKRAFHLSGGSLVDVAVRCLRRIREGFGTLPPGENEKVLAEFRDILPAVRRALIPRVKALIGDLDDDGEWEKEIGTAIDEMVRNIGAELFVSRHVAKTEAVMNHRREREGKEATEKTDDKPSVIDGLDTLAKVFEELERVVKSDEGVDERRIDHLLEQAGANLDDTVYSTREKLETLSRQLSGAEETGIIDGQGAAMDRKELLSSISEISQELMQPLTAITTLLEMLLSGYAGELNYEQRTMLEIASNSGEHLTYLMNRLIDIVGYPVNKGVDDRFHTTSDEVVQKK